MLNLSKKLTDTLVIDKEVYALDMSFDNILRLFNMLKDDNINDMLKPQIALLMLTKTEFNSFSIEECLEIFERIFEEHINLNAEDVSQYDLQGNLLPQEIIDKQKSGNKDKVFDLDYDSEYIYAAFVQAYNIDLFEVQGKLHWRKFNALLSSLPESTRFMEVIKIRSWKPNGETAKEKEKMRKLQREYALPQNL